MATTSLRTSDEKITAAKSIVQAVIHAADHMDGENYDPHWPLSAAVDLLEQAQGLLEQGSRPTPSPEDLPQLTDEMRDQMDRERDVDSELAANGAAIIGPRLEERLLELQGVAMQMHGIINCAVAAARSGNESGEHIENALVALESMADRLRGELDPFDLGSRIRRVTTEVTHA